MELMDAWKIQDSLEIYEVRHWGKGYFGINERGHVTVHPNKNPLPAVDLKDLVDQLQERGIQLPILLRFTDILRHRVGEIYEAFQIATGNAKAGCPVSKLFKAEITMDAKLEK